MRSSVTTERSQPHSYDLGVRFFYLFVLDIYDYDDYDDELKGGNTHENITIKNKISTKDVTGSKKEKMCPLLLGMDIQECRPT